MIEGPPIDQRGGGCYVPKPEETAMRRFLIGSLLTVALIAPTSAAPPSPPSTLGLPTAKCPFEPKRVSDKAVFRRLGDLPPGNQYLAVLRSDGCPAEVILAQGLGANGRQTPAPRR